MSGHSHWHSIRFKKGVVDAKRSKVFSKLSREISIAAKEGGSDLTFNPRLRTIVDKAKSFNLPLDNIDKAIKRGSGELEGFTFEEFTLEAYGPESCALIIEGITDNRNRTLSELKVILSQNNGKLVEGGAIKWMFDRKGVIRIDKENIKDKEDLELLAIESGAENFEWQDDSMIVYARIENLEKTKSFFEEKEIEIESANLEWVPKELLNIDDHAREKCEKLFNALDDHDDVQNIYSNI